MCMLTVRTAAAGTSGGGVGTVIVCRWLLLLLQLLCGQDLPSPPLPCVAGEAAVGQCEVQQRQRAGAAGKRATGAAVDVRRWGQHPVTNARFRMHMAAHYPGVSRLYKSDNEGSLLCAVPALSTI